MTSYQYPILTGAYGLDVKETNNGTEVYIPKNALCTIKNSGPNTDCYVQYKNIECSLVFEDESIDSYFEVVE